MLGNEQTIGTRMEWTAFLVAMSLLYCLYGCSSGYGSGTKDDTLNIVSISPKEVSNDKFEAIQIHFDKPVVSEKKVGSPLKKVPFEISPPLKVTAHYSDRQTLVIKPADPMKPATRYTVSLKQKLAKRVAKDQWAFSFVHDPLIVRGIYEFDTNMAPVDPVFHIRFSRKIDGAQVAKKCHIKNDKSGLLYKLQTPSLTLIDWSIPVSPKSKLQQGTDYSVECEGLVANGGNEPLQHKSKHSFSTYPTLTVIDAQPIEAVIPPEGSKVKIGFSTPVDRTAFNKKVTVLLEGKKLPNSHWERSGDGTTYQWDSFLEAASNYEIWVKKGLGDKFDQKLKKTKVVKFRTADAPPGISAENGVYAIESNGKGYQVWTRNVNLLEVECAQVPKNKMTTVLLDRELDLHPWRSSNAIDWKKYRLRPTVNKIPVAGVKNKWTSNILSLSDICGKKESSGMYLVEFRSEAVRKAKEDRGWGEYPYRLLGNVTNLGVVMKMGPASGLAWVTGISDGKPVAGANVTLYNTDGKRVAGGATDAQGMLILPGSSALHKKQKKKRDRIEDEYYYDHYRSQRFVAVVEKGADMAVVDGDWNSGIAIWNFNITSDRTDTAKRIRGFIQSDRGIYRPGEKVHFKGLVREVSIDMPPEVPSGIKAHVQIEDPSGTSLYDKKLAISRFGGFHFDLKLSEQAHLGDYYVTVGVKGQQFKESFSVEEFRPVAFEIIGGKNSKDSLIGQRQKFSFQAKYLFGAAVKDARVNWTVQRRRRHVSFSQFSGFYFDDDNSYYWDWYDDREYGYEYGTEFVADGETETNNKGKVSFSVKDSEKKLEYAQDYIAHMTVTDATDQTVTKSLVVTAHPTDVYVGLKSNGWVQSVDKPITVDTVAVKTNGESIAVNGKLLLLKERWECTKSTGYRYSSSCQRKLDEKKSIDVQIDKGGSVARITPDSPGDYIVRLNATDSRGKKVSASTSMWVTGKGGAYRSEQDSSKMTLVLSKDSYEENDVATVIPKTDTEGATILVTIERNGIIDAFTVEGKSFGEGIDIPIKPEYAPNVYVSMAVVKGRTGPGDQHRPRFALGIADMKVSTKFKELKIEIQTNKEEYEPGEKVDGKLVVTSGGKPVESEVSLSVADEGVLQLINYQTPNPMGSFYKPWGLGVDSAATMIRLARVNDPSDEDGEEGKDDGDGDGNRVRSRFVSSAYWAPALVTDANGEIAFSFDAPDNLSAFRLMAVGANTADKFGSGEKRIRIAKKLLAKPVLPRFFGSGDSIEIGAVIHNYTGKDGDALVKLDLGGLWTRQKEKTIPIKADGSARVRFRVKVSKKKKARVKLSVTMNGQGDAFEKTLPIRRNNITEQQLVGEGKNKDTVQFAVEWPSEIQQKESRLGVSIDRFGLGMLGESLRYLVQYPYGCLEQTLSKLIPMFKVGDLAKSLQLEEYRGGELKSFTTFGIAKVLRHQQDNGHFSLWPGGTTRPYLTAYALWGLSEAKNAGLKVNRKAVKKGLAALRTWTSQQKNFSNRGENANMAMAAFVLAHYNKADAGLNARLFEARNALPVYGKAFLLRAFVAAKSPKEQTDILVNELLRTVSNQGAGAFVNEESGLSRYMSSSVRTTAIVMSSFIEYDSTMPVIEKLMEGLKQKRGSSGRWANTQENIYGLIAVADYVRANTDGKAKITVRYNGKKWMQKVIRGGQIVRISKSLKGLDPGKLTITSEAPVFYHANLALVRELKGDEPVDQGISVTREYLDFESLQPVGNVKVGTIVKVVVKVKTLKSRDYVAVVDPIPAGCEAINTVLSTENSSLGKNVQVDHIWNYRELRDDRVMAFADYMGGGEWEFQYLMRATVPGEFTVAPAQGEEMYSPAIMGRSKMSTFTVRK